MRLHRELPEVEEIQVSLTNLSRAESTILRELENKSVREGEKILARYAPRAPKPDRVRAVAEGAIEVRFQASQELREKIEILKGLLAHKHPNIPLGELFEKLCDLGIETWDPGRPPKQAARARKANSPAAQQVSAPLHRLVWQKARNNQIDHRISRALGGSNTPENLRLLCRSCN
ncbi:MAG: HNH endonuclease [Bdellovibrionales bacterium]|nr:HNH endonuclease [Bdellovibrionales bacterium]